MMLYIDRQLQLEDAEDDGSIDNEDWEDMEIMDNMENMGDMYSLLALKKQQNSSFSTQAESTGSGSSTFFKDNLGGDASRCISCFL